ncbi:MAG: hypothetical protein ACD_4C00249G0006 [uncultured bacterium (gcode 4)]|uniref:Serine aminopeptidase S33 domain-containing protein n=1 Tax=uncultured bacterium (gcode 4) TaxID=1234023 RepID=K2F641_9BACT|nr:MAG: hypothetical protein ACD_4C00249G0006 [uncultured bacterium (gcode 4)]
MDKLWVQFLDNMKKYSQDKSISTINCPWLFIHWKNDDVIPLEQTTEAHDLYKWKKDLFLIDWADHSYWFYSWNDWTEDIIKIIENWIYKI